jgi:Fur family ferric uptake transcriptional regulator
MKLPFTLHDLLESMETYTHFRVSRATIYNVVNLLTDARLLVKHSLGREVRYERSLQVVPAVYLICTNCGKIRKTANKPVKEFIENNKFGRFQVTHYSLFLYGECSKCRYAKNRKRSLINKSKK